MQKGQRVSRYHEEEQEAEGDDKSLEDWKCWLWEQDNQGMVGDGHVEMMGRRMGMNGERRTLDAQ